MNILNIEELMAQNIHKYYIFKSKGGLSLNKYATKIIHSKEHHKYKEYLWKLHNALYIDYIEDYNIFLYKEVHNNNIV